MRWPLGSAPGETITAGTNLDAMVEHHTTVLYSTAYPHSEDTVALYATSSTTQLSLVHIFACLSPISPPNPQMSQLHSPHSYVHMVRIDNARTGYVPALAWIFTAHTASATVQYAA